MVTSIPEGQKKTAVPQNVRGTLALSNRDSAHILIFPMILYKSCIVTASEHLKPILTRNHVRVVALMPNLQRDSLLAP